MSDLPSFKHQFKCMYCKLDLDPEARTHLPIGGFADLPCPECGAIWRFWTHVQLDHRLIKPGKFNP